MYWSTLSNEKKIKGLTQLCGNFPLEVKSCYSFVEVKLEDSHEELSVHGELNALKPLMQYLKV